MSSPVRRPINVLHYVSNTGMTGVESYVLTVCESLERDGLHNTIACAPDGREELFARARAAGVEVVEIPLPEGERRGPVRRALGFVRHSARTIEQLRRAMVDGRVTLLHVHTASAPVTFHVFTAALLARVRAVVVTHHALLSHFAEYRTAPSRLGFWMEKRAAQRVTAYYDGHARELLDDGVRPEVMRVVPHGVDLARYAAVRRARAAEGEFRLAIVARIVEGKGHSELVRAVARLAGRYPTLRVDVVGDGPSRAALEAEVAALGVGDVVRLRGKMPNADIPAFLGDADAIVLPSYMVGEVFPVSLLEGMALGLPAIGARFSGIPSIIADGETGYVVEPGDVDSLARAIEALVRDPAAAAAMGRRAQARVRDQFSAEGQARAIEAIYAEALAGTPAGVGRLVMRNARRGAGGIAAVLAMLWGPALDLMQAMLAVQ